MFLNCFKILILKIIFFKNNIKKKQFENVDMRIEMP